MRVVETVTTCDLCSGEEDVTSVLVRYVQRRRQRTLDVCASCRDSVPLSQLFEVSQKAPARHGPKIRRRVYTEAEVAAAGKGRRKVKR